MKLERAGLLAFALLLGAAGLWYLPRPGPAPRVVPASPAYAPAPVAAEVSVKIPAAEAQTPAKPQKLKDYLLEQHPASLEGRIEARDPFVGRYRMLAHRKVLLSAEESSELLSMVSDREKWAEYREYLTKPGYGAKPFAEEQMYRLFLLQYMNSSLRADIDEGQIEFLISFILQDNFSSDLGMDIKKSLAYEKTKALALLKRYSPASLDIIRQRMVGLRHEKLLRDAFEHLPEV